MSIAAVAVTLRFGCLEDPNQSELEGLQKYCMPFPQVEVRLGDFTILQATILLNTATRYQCRLNKRGVAENRHNKRREDGKGPQQDPMAGRCETARASEYEQI